MTDAPRIFEQHAAHYERQRRRLLPHFDAFYAAAVDALALAGHRPRRVLDLGAGTGLLAREVAKAFEDVDLTLLDGAPAMLEQAAAILGDRARYVVGDMTAALPDGPWDAVVSALAIHHLEDDDKRALLGRVHDGLRPGGVFVNAEQVGAPTAALQDLYKSWHERRARAAGLSAEEWSAARERMRLDRLATVEDQLAWLGDAGFVDADCLVKDHGFAVLVARRAG